METTIFVWVVLGVILSFCEWLFVIAYIQKIFDKLEKPKKETPKKETPTYNMFFDTMDDGR